MSLPTSRTLTVIGDFADPLSYLASQRVTRLRSLDLADVTWCAVTAESAFPRAGTTLGEAAALAAATAALPLEIVPAAGTFVPNSGAASAAYAEALTESLAESLAESLIEPPVSALSIADRMRAALFDALWVEHRRIDDYEVIRRIVFDVFDAGYARADIRRRIAANESVLPHAGPHPLAISRRSGYIVTAAGAPLTTEGHRRLVSWQAAWRTRGTPELPVLIAGQRVQLTGLDALRRLGQLLDPVPGSSIVPGSSMPAPRPATVDAPLGARPSPVGAS